MINNYNDYVAMYESMEVFDGDPIEEIILFAWNDYNSYQQIESIIKSMKKKNPEDIKVDVLAKSSAMQKLVTSIIRNYEKELNMTFAKFDRKQLYQKLAEEMVERLSDF